MDGDAQSNTMIPTDQTPGERDNQRTAEAENATIRVNKDKKYPDTATGMEETSEQRQQLDMEQDTPADAPVETSAEITQKRKQIMQKLDKLGSLNDMLKEMNRKLNAVIDNH